MIKRQLSVISYQLSEKNKSRLNNSSTYGLSFILLLFTVCCLLSTVVYAETVDEKVDNLQKQLGAITDITGSFSQSSYIKDIEETQNYSGTFSIKKPDSMMWEYSEPRDEKVVISNNETWILKKGENQVIKTRFSKESYSQVPIALLVSMDKIRDDFEITMPEKNALNLIPKRKIGFIKSVLIETTTGKFPVKMFTVFDTYGNIIMIELKDVAVNSGIKDGLFKFKIPADAEIFDMSE